MKLSKRDWIINIENAASRVAAEYGKAGVDSVFRRYGAHGVCDLYTMTSLTPVSQVFASIHHQTPHVHLIYCSPQVFDEKTVLTSQQHQCDYLLFLLNALLLMACKILLLIK